MAHKEDKPGGLVVRPNPAEEQELLAWALLVGPDKLVRRLLRARPGKRKDKRRALLLDWARGRTG